MALSIFIANMPSMQINFEYDHVKASERLEMMTLKRLDKLEDKYDFIISADIIFKKENTTEQETGKICGIQLNLPGIRLYAQASHSKFEASIAETTDDLEIQLRKRKEKMKRS